MEKLGRGLDALFKNIVEDVQNTDFNFYGNEEHMKLHDRWQTEEQRKRDEDVTRLFKLYVNNYENKSKSNSWYKLGILIACLVIIAMILVFGGFVGWMLLTKEEKSLLDLASLVVAFGGLFATAISILKVITEYVFPKEEERYITEIVKAIQVNDLENKKVNIDSRLQELEKNNN